MAGSAVYNAIFKRTSTFVLVAMGATFFFERTFDLGCDVLFDKYNQGKLWKHIRANYE